MTKKIKVRKFNEILKVALKELFPTKKTLKSCCTIFVFSCYFAGKIQDLSYSIAKIISINESFNTISICLLTLVGTIYTFLIGFSKKDTFTKLIEQEYVDGKSNYLEKYMQEFESALILFFCMMFASIILLIVPVEFFYNYVDINEILKFWLIVIYLYINLKIIYEIIYVLCNAFLFIRYNLKIDLEDTDDLK